MKKRRLSPEQAFDAMSLFLQNYHARTAGKGELAAILGDIEVNKIDGRPMDPAAWDDWLAAIEVILENRGEPVPAGSRR